MGACKQQVETDREGRNTHMLNYTQKQRDTVKVRIIKSKQESQQYHRKPHTGKSLQNPWTATADCQKRVSDVVKTEFLSYFK